MKQKNRILLLMFALPLMLAGCSGAKEQLGLERKPPDEFAVVKRAPLAMPPGYTLRPPVPGAPRPQEQTADTRAKQTVFGDAQPRETSQPGSGEGLLLQQAGAQNADSDIRRKVDAETVSLHDRNKPVVEKLFGIGGDADEASASVVDAEKEAERIQSNVDSGAPVTEGETPAIEE